MSKTLRSNLLTLGVTLLGLTCLLMMAEGTARMWLWQKTDHSLEQFRKRHFIWSDQVGYYADQHQGNPLLHELGYKSIGGTEFTLIREPKDYRILILGGSAVMGKDTDLENNFPYVTGAYLTRYNPDMRCVVINGGVSGGLSFQENANLWSWRNYDFDLVVLYTGYNNLYYFFIDPEHYVASAESFKRRFSPINQMSEQLAEHSVLFARLRYWRMQRLPLAPERSTEGRPIGTVTITDALLKEFEQQYRKQLHTTLELCRQQRKPVMVIAQPFLADIQHIRPLTVYEQGIYDEYLKDRKAKWEEVVNQAYPIMLRVMRETCAAANVPFVYMAPTIADYNGAFRDDVHVHGAGINIVGAKVAQMVQQKFLQRSVQGWLVYKQIRELRLSDTNEDLPDVYRQEPIP